MTKIETIIAEIERLYCEEAEKYDTSQEIGAKRILDELSRFINSIHTKQSREDLNKEIDRFLADNVGKINNVGQIARHFAQWQKERIMKNCLYDTEVILHTRLNNREYVTLANDKLPHVPVSYGLNVGDKVKVIIVKEDEQ